MKTMKNTDMSDNQAVSKLSAEFELNNSFIGYVKKTTVTKFKPFRTGDGRNHPVTVIQLAGPKLENGKFSNKFS
tara:strand:+ start:1974 stop:2195 length:222 start_codon:yes stop_codon:yes gene_type:complete